MAKADQSCLVDWSFLTSFYLPFCYLQIYSPKLESKYEVILLQDTLCINFYNSFINITNTPIYLVIKDYCNKRLSG